MLTAIRRVYYIQELNIVYFILSNGPHLIKFLQQMINMIKLYLLKELINYLLIVNWNESAAIAQIIQNVPEMCAVSVDEVSAIFILKDVMASRKHSGEHGVRVASQRLYAGLEVHTADAESHDLGNSMRVF